MSDQKPQPPAPKPSIEGPSMPGKSVGQKTKDAFKNAALKANGMSTPRKVAITMAGGLMLAGGISMVEQPPAASTKAAPAASTSIAKADAADHLRETFTRVYVADIIADAAQATVAEKGAQLQSEFFNDTISDATVTAYNDAVNVRGQALVEREDAESALRQEILLDTPLSEKETAAVMREQAMAYSTALKASTVRISYSINQRDEARMEYKQPDTTLMSRDTQADMVAERMEGRQFSQQARANITSDLMLMEGLALGGLAFIGFGAYASSARRRDAKTDPREKAPGTLTLKPPRP